MKPQRVLSRCVLGQVREECDRTEGGELRGEPRKSSWLRSPQCPYPAETRDALFLGYGEGTAPRRVSGPAPGTEGEAASPLGTGPYSISFSFLVLEGTRF